MSNKAIFLDRDDTLIEDPGYISDPDQVRLLETVPEALNGFRKMGYKLVVVTNQSGIARGILTEETLKAIHARFKELLAEKNAYVDRIYYCPYHVDGAVDKYRKPSDNRKPNPGMLLEAARDMDIDLSASWCVGNGLSDVEAGQRAGCHTILIDQMSPTGKAKPGQIRPDYIAVNLREALNIVKQFEAAQKRHTPNPIAETEPEPTSETEAAPEDLDDTRSEAPEPGPVQPEPELEANPEAQIIPEDAVAIEAFLPPQEPEPIPRKLKRKTRRPLPLPPQDPSVVQPVTPTDQLLQNILDQLKSMQRDEMFDDFSLLRFVAGVAQIGVFVCLLTAVWFLISPERPYNPIFTALGFGVVLQVMCLTLTMQSRK
jgi:D,D-heptose 1,7-bisphosphate phosphatase